MEVLSTGCTRLQAGITYFYTRGVATISVAYSMIQNTRELILKLECYATSSVRTSTLTHGKGTGTNQRPLVPAIVDGEEVANKNHEAEQAYVLAVQAVAAKAKLPGIDWLARNTEYETANNCMNKHGGVLTGAGIHPYTPQGAMLLADAHAEGATKALAGGW